MTTNRNVLALSAGEVTRTISGWQDGDGSLAERLANAMSAAICRGELAAGWRLPPERDLAAALAVGRNTVAEAYRRLRARSMVGRRQGSGTWIEPAFASGSPREQVVGAGGHKLKSLDVGGDGHRIDLAAALSKAPPALETMLAAGTPSDLLHHTGYWPLGYPPLRTAVAALFCRRGLPTSEDNVLITSGARQAIALAAFELCRPGDLVALEDPTFPGAIDAFRRVNARISPISMDTALSVGSYAEALQAAPVRALYVMSTVHNPTGRTLSRDQRLDIVRAARQHDVLLIEDETLAELTYDSAPPPLATLAPPQSVITIGSLSKVYWGGLRVGWIRAAPPFIDRLERLKAIVDLSSSAPSQQIAVELLKQHDELRAQRVSELRSRSTLLLDLLAEHLGEWRVSEPRGGLFVWARLPHGSATELAVRASQNGVSVLHGPATSPIGRFDDHVRISFVNEPDTLIEAISRLARAWRGL
ncbi:aminotransferase-like domain-containing protein [Haloechinothrix halophila]|uniref:aminotransferase-like domain-containing protein n=1 Tax=Haloechinothrix halophila TaxID=1069073 RepID=UPI00146FAFFF|nr:PLP-dependent aminotransferase family protein [Haloechinothrix halophila]